MAQHLGKQYKIIILGVGQNKTSLLTRYLQNKFDANTKLTVGASVKFQQISDKELYEEMGIKDRFSEIIETSNGVSTDNIFHFWDLGGQRMFDKLRPSYFKGTDGIMLCFDLTDKETLLGNKNDNSREDHSIGRFLLQLIKYFGKEEIKNIPIILVGTQEDNEVELQYKEIETVIKFLFEAGLNIISHREDDLRGLKIYGNPSVGADLHKRKNAIQWVKTSAKTGENVRKAFKIIELAAKQRKRAINKDSPVLK